MNNNYKRTVVVTLGGLAGALAVVLAANHGGSFLPSAVKGFGPAPTPWQSIGGCGAGGSGSGSDGTRWIGVGVSGGLVELEVLPHLDFSRTFTYAIAVPRLTVTPFRNAEVGLSIPVGSKTAEVQYQSNLELQAMMNGGRGDLSCDFMRSFGALGQYSLQFGLTFPTGRYDEQRGADQSRRLLPQGLQMGQGTYGALLAFYYTHDFDKGMFLLDGNFNYPFMVRLDKKNEYLQTDYAAYRSVTENRERFYYRHPIKPYGESDRGDFYPASFSFSAIYAYRGVPRLVQSFQLYFRAPLGVRWIHASDPRLYDPRPDPDNRAWDAVLSYGIEFSRESFPLFMGVGLPIRDKRGNPGKDLYDPSSYGKWSVPDWENIGNEWIIALGFKVAMF